ncbi:MAG: hypothetical protein P8J55_10390 [Pseudomonadales bacterium]|nr:hypothetical protein [Pseudomonadales bacterium]
MNTTPRFSARIALPALVTLPITALAENFFSKEPVWSSGTNVSGDDGIADLSTMTAMEKGIEFEDPAEKIRTGWRKAPWVKCLYWKHLMVLWPKR